MGLEVKMSIKSITTISLYHPFCYPPKLPTVNPGTSGSAYQVGSYLIFFLLVWLQKAAAPTFLNLPITESRYIRDSNDA